MSPKKTSKKATKKPARASAGFTDDERAAMKERVRELKAQSGGSKADGEQDLLAKIAALAEPDRGMAKRLHALVTANAPALAPKTWYGMPAWARDGKIVCFFQSASKFKTRYASVGFTDSAHLDDGAMWPVGFALLKLTATEETALAALIRRAAG